MWQNSVWFSMRLNPDLWWPWCCPPAASITLAKNAKNIPNYFFITSVSPGPTDRPPNSVSLHISRIITHQMSNSWVLPTRGDPGSWRRRRVIGQHPKTERGETVSSGQIPNISLLIGRQRSRQTAADQESSQFFSSSLSKCEFPHVRGLIWADFRQPLRRLSLNETHSSRMNVTKVNLSSADFTHL